MGQETDFQAQSGTVRGRCAPGFGWRIPGRAAGPGKTGENWCLLARNDFPIPQLLFGPVAQLIERVVRNDEVSGLIPLRSTSFVMRAAASHSDGVVAAGRFTPRRGPGKMGPLPGRAAIFGRRLWRNLFAHRRYREHVTVAQIRKTTTSALALHLLRWPANRG